MFTLKSASERTKIDLLDVNDGTKVIGNGERAFAMFEVCLALADELDHNRRQWTCKMKKMSVVH
jgi:hypothetical protein